MITKVSEEVPKLQEEWSNLTSTEQNKQEKELREQFNPEGDLKKKVFFLKKIKINKNKNKQK